MIYPVADGGIQSPVATPPCRMFPVRNGLPGRPRIHPDRKAYKAAKEREYRKRRAALKEAKP